MAKVNLIALLEAAGLDHVDVIEAREHAIEALIVRVREVQRKAAAELSRSLSDMPVEKRFDALLKWQLSTEKALVAWGVDFDSAHAVAASTARWASTIDRSGNH